MRDSDSESDTRFEPQDNDSDMLWEVIAITAEKAKQYKVKWAGTDPATGKPWAQSWVPKHDVTDDLVQAWKLRNTKGKKGRHSTASSKTMSTSRASEKPTKSAPSRYDTMPIYMRQHMEKYSKHFKKRALSRAEDGSAAPPRKKRKILAESEDDDAGRSVTEDEGESFAVQRKKERTSKREEEDDDDDESSGYEELRKKKEKRKKKKVEEEDDDDEIRETLMPRDKPRATKQLRGDAKPTKRKYSRRTSATSTSTARPKSKVAPSVLASMRYSNGNRSDSSSLSPPPPSASASRSVSRKRPASDLDSSDSDLPAPPPARSKSKVSSTNSNGTKRSRREIDFTSSSEVEATSKPKSKSKEKSDLETGSTSEEDEDKQKDGKDKDKDREPTTVRYSPALSIKALNRLALFDSEIAQIDRTTLLNEEHQYEDSSPPPFDDSMYMVEPTTQKATEQAVSALFLPATREPSTIPQLSLPGSPDSSTIPQLSLPTMSNGDGDGNGGADDYVSDRERSLELDLEEVIPETESSLFGSHTLEKERSPTRSPVKSRMKPRSAGSVQKVEDIAGGSSPPRGSYMNPKASSPCDFSFFSDYVDLGSSPAEQTRKEKNEKGKEKEKKALKPIPVISPSKFTPHLPPSSLDPNSTIETAEGEPMSSLETIESFESPEKSHKRSVLEMERLEDAEEEHERVVRRGIELAESARRLKEGPKVTKISLVDLAKKRKGSKDSEVLKIFPSSSREAEMDEVQPRSPVREAASPKVDSDTHVVQEMEDAYVDLNGGMDVEEVKEVENIYTLETEPEPFDQDDEEVIQVEGEGIYTDEKEPEPFDQDDEPEPFDQDNDESIHVEHESMYLRAAFAEEEEETTQDVMRDVEVLREEVEEETQVVEDGDKTLPESQIPLPTPASGYMGDDSTRADVSKDATQSTIPSDLPSEHAMIASQLPPLDSQSQPNHETQSPLRIPSQSPAPSYASQTLRTQAAPLNESQTLHTQTAASSYETARQSSPQRPSEDVTAVQQKLESVTEHARLLEAERDTLAKTLEEMRARVAANEDTQMQLEACRNLLNSERAKHAAELATRDKAVEVAEQARAYAENDCKVIRDAYNRADSFATSLRKENTELEERATVAENQAKIGVASIRAMFEKRVKELQDDAQQWKRMANFVMEKDMRTNDEIRRKAGEHPQLELQVKDLEARLEGAVSNIHSLAKQVSEREFKIREVQREKEVAILKAQEELDVWKEEVGRLSAKLRVYAVKLGIKPEVHICEWRKGDEDPCGADFRDKLELERHTLGQHPLV